MTELSGRIHIKGSQARPCTSTDSLRSGAEHDLAESAAWAFGSRVLYKQMQCYGKKR